MNSKFRITCQFILAWMFAAIACGQGVRSSGVIGRMDNVEIVVFRESDLTTRGQL